MSAIKLRLEALSALSPAGDLAEVRSGRKWADLFSGRLRSALCDAAPLKDLEALYPSARLRRAPRLARLALRAAAGLLPAAIPPERRALVLVTAYASVGSTFEFLDSLLADGPGLASPTAFSHSVTNMGAALLSQHLDIRGPSLTLTQSDFCPALESAAVLLAAGQAETVLLGALGEGSGQMLEIEKLARPGGPAPLADGAVFFSLRLDSSSRPRPAAEFHGGAFPGQGPLAQAWRLVSALEDNRALTVLTGRPGGPLELDRLET